MPTKQAINTFQGGMNKDLDKSILPSNMYTDALNMRVTADEAGTSGAIENVKGNDLRIDIADINSNGTSRIETGQYIIGSLRVRNWLVVWTTGNYDSSNALGGFESHIYAFPIVNGNISDDSDLYINPTLDSDYKGKIVNNTTNTLDLSTLYRIKAVGRYESDTVIKVYWVDGYNNFRWMNILDTDIATQDVGMFDMISDAILPRPTISSLISGNLTAGKVQYTYQLFKSKGAETLYAPMSDLVHLTPDNENLGNSQHYEGGGFDVATNKGVRISIVNTNTGYDFIRGIALHYNSLNALPTVRIFDEQAIDSTGSTITLNDVGNELGTVEFDNFSVANRSLFVSQEIETKDNYLFTANITESEFDVTGYDTRSYRFEAANDTKLYHSYTDANNYTYLDITAGTTLATYTWTEYLVTTGDPFPGTATTNTYTTATIPSTYDCINLFNNYANDGTGNYQYKYQSNGSTLGASGTNIDIEFAVDPVIIDYNIDRFIPGATVDATPVYQQTESASDNTSYTGYASSYIGAKYMGNMRDEIYRYAIVYFDGKGRKSYAKWIIDLRMPTHADHAVAGLFGSDIVGNILVPKFNVKNLPSGASAYQIVRTRRSGFDNRNILAQGLLTASEVNTGIEYPVDVGDGDATIINAAEYVYLNSPEISFNKNLSYSSGDQLVVMSNNYIAHPYTAVANAGGGELTFTTNDTTGLSALDNVIITGTSLYNGEYQVESVVANTSFNITETYSGTESGAWTPKGGIYQNINAGVDTEIVKASKWLGVTLVAASMDTIDDAVIISPGDFTHNLGGTNDVYIYDDTGADLFFKGTSLLVKYSGSVTWTPAAAATTDRLRFLCNYRRNNWLSQYGGNTYEDRSRNTYIAADDIRTAATNANCYGGDTFITYFNYVNLVSDLSQVRTAYRMEGVFFPVETTINCDLRHDKSDINKLLPASTTEQKLKLIMTQETGGTQTDTTGTPNVYEQETDLYLYNTVYSQENTSVSHIATPVAALYSITDTFDTRIKYSDEKIDGEVSDSWFKFRSSNFVDLNKVHGSVNNLAIYKDNLLFWQDHAFGTLAVKQRAVLSTEAGEGLVLGTGGLLDNTDYITTSIGNTNRFGIAVSDKSCYWIDNEVKELFQFTAGTRGAYNLQSKNDPLGSAKGMRSYLKSLDNIGYVDAIVDRANDEVLFTVAPSRFGTTNKGVNANKITGDGTNTVAGEFVIVDGKHFYITGRSDAFVGLNDLSDFYTAGSDLYFAVEYDKVTFSFNEIINSFGTFYSFKPGIYVDCGNYFFTNESSASRELYLHDAGNYGYFYGTYYPSTVTFNVNPDYGITKTFDNLNWVTETITSAGINRFSDTWDKIQCYNDYQNSDELDLIFRTTVATTDIAFDRRERGFSMAIPRNAVDKDVSDNPDIFSSANLDVTQTYKERIRDKYFTVKFTYTNDSDNYRISCPYVGTKYRNSIR